MKKDLHYLITRIINPHLNTVIAILNERARNYSYRVDYTDFKYKPSEQIAAEMLKDWRDGIFHRYLGRDIQTAKDEFIEDYFHLLNDISHILLGSTLRDKTMKILWEIGGKIQAFLGVHSDITLEDMLKVENIMMGDFDEDMVPKEKYMKLLKHANKLKDMAAWLTTENERLREMNNALRKDIKSAYERVEEIKNEMEIEKQRAFRNGFIVGFLSILVVVVLYFWAT